MENANIGIGIPEILLPNLNINMKKWSVIACDQFTSQMEYWTQVQKTVGNAPSVLQMILPEVYLNYEGLSDSISNIKNAMQEYLHKGVLEQLPKGIILTERTFTGGRVRKGLNIMIDLEQYDYNHANKPLIRATEKTLLERIPPRVTIRQGAPLETSHVLVMIDDKQDTVIEPLYAMRDTLEKLYDFDLMLGGGKLKGYFIEDETLLQNVLDAIASLPMKDGMRFCVGDGNHSLAAAKTVWEIAKENLTEEERENNPLRYALCELVNIHDDGIEFKPIHRILFKVNPTICLEYIVDRLNKNGARAKIIFGRWRGGQEASSEMEIPFLYRDGAGKIILENKSHPLLIGEVQDILDDYMKDNPNGRIDYIHGQETFEELSRTYDNLGLYFAPMSKDTFFETVIQCGVLPKKSFSLGEAEEKRYYTECRLLMKPEQEKKEEPAADETTETIETVETTSADGPDEQNKISETNEAEAEK